MNNQPEQLSRKDRKKQRREQIAAANEGTTTLDNDTGKPVIEEVPGNAVAVKDCSPIGESDKLVLDKLVPVNERQSQDKLAFVNMLDSSRTYMVQFEKALNDYWHNDSCNPQNLLFNLNLMTVRPKMFENCIKILPNFVSLDLVKGDDGFWIGTNKNISKSKKEAHRQQVSELQAKALKSISNHPDVKKDSNKIFNKVKKMSEASTRLQTLVDNGISFKELHRMVDSLTVPQADNVIPVQSGKASSSTDDVKDYTDAEIEAYLSKEELAG